MLNYIWAGLIILSLAFALLKDVDDILFDRYRNGKSLQVQIDGRGSDVKVRIDPAKYKAFYGVDERVAESYPATMVLTSRGKELRFPASAALPPLLGKIRDATSGDDPKWLLAAVTQFDESTGESAIRFESVRWVTIAQVGDAAVNMSRTAVELSLKLIGTLALFLGIMQIAEKAGIIDMIVVVTGPILRPLFPGIPKGHPAMGLVTLNLTANMLGLGNAATPFGIKAMEELQKLNKTTDTATNAMVMLLAMNTAGVQLLPPMMLYAVMGLRASELYFPILIVTGICLAIAIVSAKLLERAGGYRDSDPDRLPARVEAA